ncbi:hypothetical protein BFW01_g3826 [Lasiodiplodia theobromae]|nr:hypothetical protein BFW01_g3826 [Lasiodiplodia theobromae]
MNLSRPPDRPLQLHIDGSDNPNRVYSNNDVVSGVVKVDTRQKIESVSISFSGTATARLTRIHASGIGSAHQTCEGRSTLFRYHERLFETGNSNAAAIESYAANRDGPFVSFPFRFRFPSTAQCHDTSSRRGMNSLEPNPNFECDPDHPLPPSMSAEVDTHYQSVQYLVEARMTTTALKIFSGSKEDREMVRFVPSCLNSSAAEAPNFIERAVTLTRHSKQLDPSYEPHGKLREKLKEVLPASSSDPHASFTVVTRAPATTRSGAQELPIFFSITHGERSPELLAPPELYLKGFRVALTAVDKARVKYTGLQGSEITGRRMHDITLAERRWGEEDGPPQLDAGGGEEVALASLAEEGKVVVSKGVRPTFKTYGLARSYALRVKLWIECAGKTFEVEGAGHEILVLPWPDLRGEGEGAAVKREQDEMEEGGAPPPYEAVHDGPSPMGGF